MQAKFLNYDGQLIREAEVVSPAMATTKIISFGGMFFELKEVVNDELFVYTRCRGEFLSAIKLRKRGEYHV